jgi:hypothetical protein
MKSIISSYLKDCPFGFGDFLRGSLALKHECVARNLDFSLDFSGHEVGNYIKSKKDVSFCKERGTETFYMKFQELSDFLDNTDSDSVRLCSNSFHGDSGDLNVNEAQLFFESLLEESVTSWFSDNIVFSDEVVNEFNKRTSINNLKDYEVIHFRVGDDYSFFDGEESLYRSSPASKAPMFSEYFFEKLFERIIKQNQFKDKNIVFMCDSEKVKNNVKNIIIKSQIKNCFVLSGSPCHTSSSMLFKRFKNPKVEPLFETFLDLYTISKANKVSSYCAYDFISNFVRWPCLIYGVKLDGFSFYELIKK